MILSVMFSPFVFHIFSQIIYFSMLNIFKVMHTIAIQIADQSRFHSSYSEEALFST